MSRETLRDVDVQNLHLPKGATALISPYLLQRSERSFDEPLAFRPERFERGLDARGREAYIPFSTGPRACVGAAFATMLALMIIPRVLQRFTLRTEKLPDVDATLTLRPRQPMRVVVTARQERPASQVRPSA